MNHFLVDGSAGAAWSGDASPVPSAAGSATGVCSSGFEFSGNISSGINLFGREGIEQFLNQAADDVIDHEKIRRERESGSDHDGRGCPYLFPGGPGDPAHLHAEIVDITLDAGQPVDRFLGN